MFITKNLLTLIKKHVDNFQLIHTKTQSNKLCENTPKYDKKYLRKLYEKIC